MPKMTHILLSAGYPQTLNTAGTGGVSLVQPPNNHRQTKVRAVTFTGMLPGLVGAPTGWSLEARFQILQVHTSGYQNSRPEWMDVDAGFLGAKVSGATINAAGTVQIASSEAGTAFPHFFAVTIPELHVDSVRLRFYPVFTGGTDPGFKSPALTMTED
ncbi:hypothetical protein GCM10022377_10300 [Zhihengliuella alba]|uniref:Uncharacterized protein n=1 Tax=Zhihengliuella alba TaxID=547018 RepID=A0ABP7D4P6_9MICC